ncbi:MAG: beta-ketoacyl synthase chain length factor [Methylococcales bacterium]
MHGKLAKSVQMLQRIAVGEKLSPTAFSLSVDNAIARFSHAIQVDAEGRHT